MFCENCGAKIEYDAGFCPECGQKIEETGFQPAPEPQIEPLPEPEPQPQIEPEPEPQEEPAAPSYQYCHECGAQNQMGALFCCGCGKPMKQETASFEAKKGHGAGKAVLAVGITAAVVLAAVILICIGFGKRGASVNDIVYLKDNSLYRVSLKDMEPEELDTRMVDDENWESMQYGLMARYSADGKYLFYRKLDGDGNIKLYCIQTGEKEKEPEKIDSGDIRFFEVLPDNRVAYIKEDSLYLHDLADKVKLASDVATFEVSADATKVLWKTVEDGHMYVQDIAAADSDREKLESGVDWVCYRNEDLSRLVYEKNGSVYLLKDLTEKEKVASDVDSVFGIYEAGGEILIPYIKNSSDEEISLMEIVDDDMADADASITEPREEDYQVERQVSSFWGTHIVTETSDEYYVKLEEYGAKQNRDMLRNILGERTIGLFNQEMYLYRESSKESEKLLEGCFGYMNDDYSGGPVLFDYANEEDIPHVKFSKLCESDNGDELFWQAYNKALKQYLLLGTQLVQVSDDDSYVREFCPDGSWDKMYVLKTERSPENQDESELGEISLLEKSFGGYTKLYDEVQMLCGSMDGKVYYMKDIDDSRRVGDLYCGGDRVDYEVYNGRYFNVDMAGSILYYTDMDSEGWAGTLKSYNGEESLKIADDVYDNVICPDGRIALLADYSKKHHKGDLKLFDGKELETLDTDISGIIIAGNYVENDYIWLEAGQVSTDLEQAPADNAPVDGAL